MTTPRKGVKTTSVSKMLAVLRLIAEGNTNAQIARELGISEDTVKGRARALFEDLGARDRAHAVAIGYQRGLLRAVPHDPSCSSHGPRTCDCKVGAL